MTIPKDSEVRLQRRTDFPGETTSVGSSGKSTDRQKGDRYRCRLDLTSNTEWKQQNGHTNTNTTRRIGLTGKSRDK